jgi:hypothetical protein
LRTVLVRDLIVRLRPLHEDLLEHAAYRLVRQVEEHDSRATRKGYGQGELFDSSGEICCGVGWRVVKEQATLAHMNVTSLTDLPFSPGRSALGPLARLRVDHYPRRPAFATSGFVRKARRRSGRSASGAA